MTVRILPANPQTILEAVEALKRGNLVAFPTDTVYGIGAHPFIPEAIKKVYQAKGRRESKALALLLAEASQLEAVAEVNEHARVLAERFWPGGLTLVLHPKPNMPSLLYSQGRKIGVRVPAHPVVSELIKALGAPIVNSSANRSGGADNLKAADVYRELDDWLDIIIEGICPGGIPSTVVDVTQRPPAILRLGIISAKAIEKALGEPLAYQQQ